MSGDGFGVVAVGSCNVSLELNSQWRNREHWHAVWPEGEGHWCYETQAEAADRVEEVRLIRLGRSMTGSEIGAALSWGIESGAIEIPPEGSAVLSTAEVRAALGLDD